MKFIQGIKATLRDDTFWTYVAITVLFGIAVSFTW